jgi:hypothetical protein
MTASHSSYEELASARRGSLDYREGYAEAQRAYLIGQAVRERRLALGLSQVDLASRAGMTQPALSREPADARTRPRSCLLPLNCGDVSQRTHHLELAAQDQMYQSVPTPSEFGLLRSAVYSPQQPR